MINHFLKFLPPKFFLNIALCVVVTAATGCSAGLDEFKQDTNERFLEVSGIQAEHTASLNEIRNQLRELSGSVEELQHVSTGKTRQLEQSLQQLGSRVPPPPGVPAELLAEDETRIAAIQGPAAEQYRSALRALRSGDFTGARNTLADFIASNPGTAFTDNALFWQGIVYTKLGQTNQAMVSFSDVYESYPAEDMVAPSLYHLAESFLLSGAAEDAELTFQKVVDGYPSSRYAAKAKGQLRRLNKR